MSNFSKFCPFLFSILLSFAIIFSFRSYLLFTTARYREKYTALERLYITDSSAIKKGNANIVRNSVGAVIRLAYEYTTHQVVVKKKDE